MNTNDEILVERAKIQKQIEAIKREIVAVSRYRKAAEVLLATLETAYDEYHAATRALTDNKWKENFD